jgi:hypothetical protein
MRQDGEFYSSFLYVENSIGGFPLRKDRLILGKYCECPANVNGRKEGLRIEVSALLDAATNAVRETNAVPL